MTELQRRDIVESDWPAILALANASVAHVPGAGTQEEWFENRRAFDLSAGTQEHYLLEDSGEIVGYGSVEQNADGEFRMFLVALPERLDTVGERLYDENLALAKARGAPRIWFTEYADDAALVRFAMAREFDELGRIHLGEGVEAITMMKRLG
jgi:hypothetical protein